MFVVCAEHLEEALDKFVEEYDAPPDIYVLNDISFTAWTAPSTCEFCTAKPKYLVI